MLIKNQKPIGASWVQSESKVWLRCQMLVFPLIHASVLLLAPHFHHHLHHQENPLRVHFTHSTLQLSKTQMWGRRSPLACIRGSQCIRFNDIGKELAGMVMFYHD